MFSVIIPCHNQVAILEKVLAGLVVQTAAINFEVILIDNDSREEDLNVVYHHYADKLPLYLVKQPRLPHPMAPCKARNIGIQLAQYDWIINLDSDCIPNKNYFAYLQAYLIAEKESNLIITGHRVFIESNDFTDQDILEDNIELNTITEIPSVSNYYLKKDRRLMLLDSYEKCPHPWALIHTCNVIYRKDTAIQAGCFDETFDGCWGYEDTDFAHRMITMGQAMPRYLSTIECYHQESFVSNHEERFNKTNNRNWHLIRQRIPGIEEFKKSFYQQLNPEIKVN